ncbi:hypothetical protein ACFRJ3_15025 [Streptomyces sp. NPDC056696]|uniref:hypothetical protein n=1 Tax=unclassified Streptomyces TaxID=2593676 RepID=UPI0036CAB9FE
MRLDLRDAERRTAARRALDAENALLPHRRFPRSELRRLLGRNPFEVTFDQVRFHPRDELLAAGLLATSPTPGSASGAGRGLRRPRPGARPARIAPSGTKPHYALFHG